MYCVCTYLVIGVVLIIVEEGQEGGVLEAALCEWIREQEYVHHVHGKQHIVQASPWQHC